MYSPHVASRSTPRESSTPPLARWGRVYTCACAWLPTGASGSASCAGKLWLSYFQQNRLNTRDVSGKNWKQLMKGCLPEILGRYRLLSVRCCNFIGLIYRGNISVNKRSREIYCSEINGLLPDLLLNEFIAIWSNACVLQTQHSLAPTRHHDIALGGEEDLICDIVV